MAFNIAEAFGEVLAQNTKEQIEYIPLQNIVPDPSNFYSLDGLDELAGNIELIGLQQPIRVRKGEDGNYIIVSGHRRRAAILMIQDGGSDQFKDGVPCIVEQGQESAAMRELRLIYANASTRVMSSAEIARQAERVEALLYQLKEEGVEFPGRMRDHVAEACKVSKSKLARLHAIRKNLCAGFMTYFEKGELKEETAYQLSRLPADVQEMAAEEVISGKRKNLPYGYTVEKIVKDLDSYLKELPCVSHAGAPDCHHKKEKIVRSLFQYDYQMCHPGECCRDCCRWKDCSRACQECKDRRKLEKDVEKEKAAEREKNESVQQELYKKSRKRQAKRIMKAIEAAGLKDEDALPAQWSWEKDNLTVAKLRKMSKGDFGNDHYYNDNLMPTSADQLRSWAKKLDCSADYLLGLTDDLKISVSESDTISATAGKWSTGTPTEAGDYVIIYGVSKEETEATRSETISRWDGELWISPRTGTQWMNGMTVYRWVKLPEV